MPAARIVLLSLCLCVLPAVGAAQRVSPLPDPWTPLQSRTGPPPVAPAPASRLVLGGIAGAAATLGLAAAVGSASGERLCGDYSCGGLNALAVAVLAEPFLVPAGVHVANRRRGSYTTAAAVSSAIWFGGLMLGSRSRVPGEYILLLPVAQIATSVIIIDRSTPRSP